MELPLYRPAVKNEIPKTTIPLEIVQTYKSQRVHPAIHANVMRLLEANPECGYRFITDEVGRELIREHFDESVSAAFERLGVGAAKGDFLRYVALYVYGGIYLDLDSGLDLHLPSFLSGLSDPPCVFFHDGTPNIIQWCFMVAPRHELLLDIIHEMVLRIQNKEKNIFLATGPALVSDVFFRRITGQKLYDCSRSAFKREREQAWKLTMPSLGILTREPPQLLFRFKGFHNSMLYTDGQQHYTVRNGVTPGFFVD